ncbi:hypothetical protein PENTCL1PPCAC_12427, partial [Pristionchus entomophagus]
FQMSDNIETLELSRIKSIDCKLHCLQTIENGIIFYWRGSSIDVRELFVMINDKPVFAKLPSDPLFNPSVKNDSFYFYQQTNKANRYLLIKVSLVELALKLEIIKEVPSGVGVNTYQPLYMWNQQGTDIHIHPFERANGETKLNCFKQPPNKTIDSLHKWIVHRGRLIILTPGSKTNPRVLFEPATATNQIITLTGVGHTFDLYVNDVLDCILVLDRQHGTLWIANPTSKQITTFSLNNETNAIHTFVLVGVFENKLLIQRNEISRETGDTSSDLMMALLPSSTKIDVGRNRGVETASMLLQTERSTASPTRTEREEKKTIPQAMQEKKTKQVKQEPAKKKQTMESQKEPVKNQKRTNNRQTIATRIVNDTTLNFDLPAVPSDGITVSNAETDIASLEERMKRLAQ